MQEVGGHPLRAEIKLGSMLAATERNPGVQTIGAGGKIAGGDMRVPPANVPTLAELGVTKRESVETQ
jgi:hypothetical protein